MASNKDKVNDEQFDELLKIFLIHHQFLGKFNPKDLGFVKRKVFLTHKNKVDKLKEDLENV